MLASVISSGSVGFSAIMFVLLGISVAFINKKG